MKKLLVIPLIFFVSVCFADYTLKNSTMSHTYISDNGSNEVYVNLDDTYVVTIASANQYLLSKDSATSTYLEKSSATATYLQKSSATATYLDLNSAASIYLTQSSATLTYLNKSSATLTYLDVSSAVLTYISKSSATLNFQPIGSYLTTSSATATYQPKGSYLTSDNYYMDDSGAQIVNGTDTTKGLLFYLDGEPTATIQSIRPPYFISTYARGTTYLVTTTTAAVDFGTTDPSITIDRPGSYLLSAMVQVDFTSATYAAVANFETNIYRTNNTAGVLANTLSRKIMPVVTGSTQTWTTVNINPVLYSTTNYTDILTIYSGFSAAPSEGTVKITSATINAWRIY